MKKPGAKQLQEQIKRAQTVFRDMQREYAAGNFTRYGELLQQLEKILSPP